MDFYKCDLVVEITNEIFLSVPKAFLYLARCFWPAWVDDSFFRSISIVVTTVLAAAIKIIRLSRLTLNFPSNE